MSQYNLERIFKPHRVAVVGAGEKTGSIGNALMKNLIEGGFSETLLPVNPKYKTTHLSHHIRNIVNQATDSPPPYRDRGALLPDMSETPYVHYRFRGRTGGAPETKKGPRRFLPQPFGFCWQGDKDSNFG